MGSLALALFGCDIIDPNKARELPAPTDTSNLDTTSAGAIAMVRRVLLYDFTGHTCGNCPAAHLVAADLKKAHGDRLAIVNVHAGYFAEPKPAAYIRFTYDYRTQAGTALDNQYGASSAALPKGVVDGVAANGSYVFSQTAWPALVSQRLALPCVVGLGGSVTYSGNTLGLTIRARPAQALNKNMQLVVYLIEDSLINWQKNYAKNPNDLPDYIHKYMLREQLVYVPAFLKQGAILEKRQSFTISQLLKNAVSHYHALAVLKADDGEVMQVLEMLITPQ